VLANLISNRGWKCLKVAGPLDLALTGILACLLEPLAKARISVFSVSTFDTDYRLVKAEYLATATRPLFHVRTSRSRPLAVNIGLTAESQALH
jgi:hypothetical protein